MRREGTPAAPIESLQDRCPFSPRADTCVVNNDNVIHFFHDAFRTLPFEPTTCAHCTLLHMDISPEDTARLQELRKALESEFEVRQSQPSPSIKDVFDLKDDALEALRYVLRHGQNDTLKSKVAMWVYDRSIQSEDQRSEDELLDLLRNMPNNPQVEASDTT